MLCHCDSIIVLDSNNSITYIGRNIVFLNGTSGVSFEDTKKNISGRLEFNYNDVEIDITRRCLVEEQQYFSIPISCDVGFRNMMEKFFQNRTKMMELYVSSQPKLVDHIIWSMKILIYLCPYLLDHLNSYHIQLGLVHLRH